jgi:uncharacterized membrane protein YdbT with pleckstrin-like domain
MSYVTKVLHPDERVIAIGHMHWIIYMRAAFVAVLGIVIIAFGNGFHGFGNGLNFDVGIWISALGVLILVLAAIMAFGAWFEAWTTEIAVTNRRVIQKKGFIRRNTSEMDKVESVIVDQSLLGRVFDYGSVVVRGTGAGLEGLRFIGKPLDLRSAIVTPDSKFGAHPAHMPPAAPTPPAPPAPPATPPPST